MIKRSDVLSFIANRLFDARDAGRLRDRPHEWPSDQAFDDAVAAHHGWPIEIVLDHCPRCGMKLLHASGIGHFCPNHECPVADRIYPALSGCLNCYPGKPGCHPKTRYNGWRLICPHSIFSREL